MFLRRGSVNKKSDVQQLNTNAQVSKSNKILNGATARMCHSLFTI